MSRQRSLPRGKTGEDFDLERYQEKIFEWKFLKKFSSCFSSARTLNNSSGLIKESEETCNETAGYKKLCNVGGKKRRCRLCATCIKGYVRFGSVCKKCKSEASVVYFIGCLLVFCIFLSDTYKFES